MSTLPIYTCGEIDLYDNLNGSVLVAWPPFQGGLPDDSGDNGAPDSFNIYVNGVLWTDVVFLNTVGFAAFHILLEDGSGSILLENDAFRTKLEAGAGLSTGSAFAALVSGLTIASYNPSAVAAPSGNSLRPQNMPPVGVVTPSGTYDIRVVAVLSGAEVATSPSRRITPCPASTMLRTPMKRLWPFPNTGLD